MTRTKVRTIATKIAISLKVRKTAKKMVAEAGDAVAGSLPRKMLVPCKR